MILDFFIKSISTDITDVAPLKDFSWMTHSEESCQASIFNQQLSLKETNSFLNAIMPKKKISAQTININFLSLKNVKFKRLHFTVT